VAIGNLRCQIFDNGAVSAQGEELCLVKVRLSGLPLRLRSMVILFVSFMARKFPSSIGDLAVAIVLLDSATGMAGCTGRKLIGRKTKGTYLSLYK